MGRQGLAGIDHTQVSIEARARKHDLLKLVTARVVEGNRRARAAGAQKKSKCEADRVSHHRGPDSMTSPITRAA